MKPRPEDTGSLPLSQVLEDEYRLLHGPLPSDFPAHDTEPARVRELIRQVHSLDEKRTALCFSGGGIRSATYCLGVLRSLSRLRLLDKFDYLSTVSGGGYIGSWLTAWIHRHPRGLPGVMTALAGDRPGFEEAMRALYAGERDKVEALTQRWPKAIRSQIDRMMGWQ